MRTSRSRLPLAFIRRSRGATLTVIAATTLGMLAVGTASAAALGPSSGVAARKAIPGPAGPPVTAHAGVSPRTVSPRLAYENCTSAGPTSADATLAGALSSQINTPRMVGIDSGQVSCARIIVSTVRSDGLDERAAVIALTTAITESTLHDYTQADDGTSLGLYQQQTSEGWGTAAQVEDPVYSTNSFLNVMEQMYPNDSWNSGDIGAICQAVQRSAYPGAYDPEEPAAQLLADNLWSGSAGQESSPVVKYNTQMELYGLTSSGATDSDVYTPGGTWSNWSSLGGDLAGHPTAIQYGVQLEVFGRQASGAVETDVYTPGKGWSNWQPLNGDLASDPVAIEYNSAQYGDQMQVYGIAADGSVWYDVYTPGYSWSGWNTLGGDLTGQLSVTTYGSQMQVFGRTPTGATESDVYTPSTGKWSTWQSIGGNLATGPIAIEYNSAQYGDQMQVYGIAADGSVWYDVYTPGYSWSGWNTLGGDLTGQLSVTTYGSQMQVFGRTPTGATESDVYTPSTGKWSTWQSIGGNLATDPIAIEYDTQQYGDQMEVYGIAAGGAMWYDVYTPGYSWSGWNSLGGDLT